MFCQVKFRYLVDDENVVFGGIAKLDDNNNVEYVICGCCGNVFEPDQIKILTKFQTWVNISDEILGIWT